MRPAAPPGILLRGGSVIGADGDPVRTDVVVDGGRIAAVAPPGTVDAPTSAQVVDCAGRLLMPGFVDAHSHAGSLVFEADVQLALLRQGVTTIVTGQDGVSPAPGDGGYAAEYFAAIDGPHPSYRGDGIAGLLATYDGTVPVNVATLVPAGTVRQLVCGDAPGPASGVQRGAMRALVRQGLVDGAVGLATGLDYVPGLHADTDELVDLCHEVAAVDALYVSHMRGGYESNVRAGLDEMASIVRGSGVRAHVSHLHAPVDLARRTLADLAATGTPLTFDAYPYSRGCTILSMLVLPPELAAPGTDGLARAVRSAEGCSTVQEAILERVLGRADLGTDWSDAMTLSHVPTDRYRQHQGSTVTDAATAEGTDPVSFVIDLLIAARLQVTAIMRVPHPRSATELAPLYRMPGHMAGSDGIFVGSHPHPRAYGTFATYLADHVRPGLLSWSEAVEHLSTTAVRHFRLGERGVLRPGAVADIVVVDQDRVAAASTYEAPMRPAVGIDDVLVAGRVVLRDGSLTGATPGTGLRRV
ncbi:N-acyl-D-amino-acid deacylase family protein [Curtobacterium sp. RRHDQ10]|uniref:N-acyl-D-amino-acid deacylase family protein n=1 Tax=Curtobacterium phyllosphaerae TaxID=3413379 RepID=UPI003BF2A16F